MAQSFQKRSQIIRSHAEYSSLCLRSRASAVCIGNFDGVHRGHQAVFRKCLEGARERSLSTLLFTFEPHPVSFLKKGDISLILNPEEKRELLQKVGFDVLLFQTFDDQFSKIEAKKFIQKVLVESLQTKVVVVGTNFHFGLKAKGSIEDLKNIEDFETLSSEWIERGHAPLSSSRIREHILRGEIDVVNELLGYPYFVTGIVTKGDGRGHSLGFPTLNLNYEKGCLLSKGVYASIAQDLQSGLNFCGVTNIGTNPTFNGNQMKIETHLLRFKDDLVNREMRIFFLRRLRDEMRFDGAEPLKAQIKKDLQKCTAFFADQKLLRTSSASSPLSLSNSDAKTQNFKAFKIIEELSRSVSS